MDEVAGLRGEEGRQHHGTLDDVTEDGLRHSGEDWRTFTELPLKGTMPTMIW